MRLQSDVITIKERLTMLFLRYGRLDVEDGAFVFVDETGSWTQIPVGGVACLLLEPGTTITHAAVGLAAECGTLLLWVGEGGVRLYSAGQPGGARSDRLLYQARLALQDDLRLKVVRSMYRYRFKEEPPEHRSIAQLQAIEASRVKKLYKQFALQFGVKWVCRNYDPDNWGESDPINKALNVANHCLYGVCEAAVLAAGYAPAVGFIHTGKPLSFVYDIADLFKFETVVPAAFRIAAKKSVDVERDVRHACRDMFRQQRISARIIPVIEEVLSAGGISLPKSPPESVAPAIPVKRGLGDAGHRH